MMLVCACIGLAACGEHTHKFKKYIYNDDATCTEDGTETAQCECGERDTRVKEGSALGHRYGDWHSDNNATCMTNCTQTRFCRRCKIPQTEEIPDSTVWHKVTFHEGTATCTEFGTVPYYECEYCHKNFKDEAATWEETDLTDRILGHEYTATNRCLRYDVCESEWSYTSGLEFRLNEDDTYTLKGTTNRSVSQIGSLTVPYGYQGKYVTAIDSEAFSEVTVSGILTLTERITSIGDRAFKDNMYLRSVVLPERLTYLGKEAFSGCLRLDSITIPDSLTRIEENAFNGCTALKSITLGKGLTSIGNQAFNNCTAVEGDLAIPDSVETIGERAFMGLTISGLTLGSGLKTIGDNAFQLCTNITSLVIPASVVSIGKGAFLFCRGLTSVTFEAPTGWYIEGETNAVSGLDSEAEAADLIRSEYSDVAWERKQ